MGWWEGETGQKKVPGWCHPLVVSSLGLVGTTSVMLLSLRRNPCLLLDKWFTCFLRYGGLSSTAGLCVLSWGAWVAPELKAPEDGDEQGVPHSSR